MKQRGCGLGCIITGLGLLLSLCLLPYLLSSIYSLVTALLQVPGAPDWLWGDWLSTVVGTNNTAYMVLAEGPICCVGTLALLIIILGVVMMISRLGSRDEEYDEQEYDVEEYEQYFQPKP
jgi:hypothetical protein